MLSFKKWTFLFIVIGMNPITVYFLDGFVNFDGIAEFFTGGLASHAGVRAALILSLAALIVRWWLLRLLYRHKIFFRV
ncbi:hypothetical protein [Anaerobaca lacustris]|uniref:Uncharacterized protein n=1 Tax=Anaerobaca lacustris TaxID=3044600 RepID=A0AAW6U1V8_9BACT|nr:hypothetical protein [Sedimentisphaerales bacterium M17dextr]